MQTPSRGCVTRIVSTPIGVVAALGTGPSLPLSLNKIERVFEVRKSFARAPSVGEIAASVGVQILNLKMKVRSFLAV